METLKKEKVDLLELSKNNAAGFDPTGKNIFFYDGVCVYCRDVVNACITSDNDKLFYYSPLQSHFAQNALKRYGINSLDLLSMYVISNYNTSEEFLMNAACASNFVLTRLHGEMKNIGIENSKKPRAQQDEDYKYVADNRYEKYGKFDDIDIPSPQFRNKFLF